LLLHHRCRDGCRSGPVHEPGDRRAAGEDGRRQNCCQCE